MYRFLDKKIVIRYPFCRMLEMWKLVVILFAIKVKRAMKNQAAAFSLLSHHSSHTLCTSLLELFD